MQTSLSKPTKRPRKNGAACEIFTDSSIKKEGESLKIRRSAQIADTLLENLMVAHGQICKKLDATPKELLKLARGILKLSDQLGDEIIQVGPEVNE